MLVGSPLRIHLISTSTILQPLQGQAIPDTGVFKANSSPDPPEDPTPASATIVTVVIEATTLGTVMGITVGIQSIGMTPATQDLIVAIMRIGGATIILVGKRLLGVTDTTPPHTDIPLAPLTSPIFIATIINPRGKPSIVLSLINSTSIPNHQG
jgi:hypothetical protein